MFQGPSRRVCEFADSRCWLLRVRFGARALSLIRFRAYGLGFRVLRFGGFVLGLGSRV